MSEAFILVLIDMFDPLMGPQWVSQTHSGLRLLIVDTNRKSYFCSDPEYKSHSSLCHSKALTQAQRQQEKCIYILKIVVRTSLLRVKTHKKYPNSSFKPL